MDETRVEILDLFLDVDGVTETSELRTFRVHRNRSDGEGQLVIIEVMDHGAEASPRVWVRVYDPVRPAIKPPALHGATVREALILMDWSLLDH